MFIVFVGILERQELECWNFKTAREWSDVLLEKFMANIGMNVLYLSVLQVLE